MDPKFKVGDLVRCRFSAIAAFCAATLLGIESARAADPAKGLYLASPDGELRLIVPWEDGVVITSPQQSPDGKWVAFNKTSSFNEAGQPDPQYCHVWAAAIEGGKPRDLGPGATPAWSPDSKQICCTVFDGAPDAKPGMYIMNADGSGRQWLFEGIGGRWSPDGSRIAFYNAFNVHVYDTLSGDTIQLSNNRYYFSGTPAWSPDGEKVAVIHRNNDHTLAIFDSHKERQPEQVIAANHGMARSPSWTPNENILLAAKRNDITDIYAFSLTGRDEPQRPFEGKFRFNPKDPMWAADGKSIVFIKPN